MTPPPTSRLPPIRQIASHRINNLQEALLYLRHLYNPQSHKEWEGLVQEAASLLAVCSGTAGAGVVIRDFVFKLGPEMEQTLDIQVKDISLDNKDYGSVGAQTWGGACVLTETILDDPVAFGLFDARELRILELGAGTGLVSLALGKLVKSTGSSIPPRTIIATDYYPSVMENLAQIYKEIFLTQTPFKLGFSIGRCSPPRLQNRHLIYLSILS
ncbi:hypothetical protein C0995_007734 [Termitomyces sp. Mi166|nr:hypothetical protein C0995_007734 [Termitomyces sp. Mi166\